MAPQYTATASVLYAHKLGLARKIADYNTQAPHSALGMRSPAEYRAEVTLSFSG